MRSEQLAEAVASLVTPADRAASVIGDLLEDAPRDALRFWRSVARLTVSLLGGDLCAAPVR